MSEIIDVSASNQFIEDYRRYGLYILYRRVMPDIRDGLKPVQRRILWTLFNDEKAYGGPSSNVKCAAVVGTTIKKYHPHGDTAVYDTMKPLINSFECNYPLIKGKGNFGTIQGDSASAYRYTECRLSEFAMDCIFDDMKYLQAVDWMDTFDNKNKEPEYLPVKVPLLLINGSFGIGIGDRAEVQSNNLREVIDATLAILDNPNADITLIPDHCMPCEIISTNFNEISRKGFGHYYIRGIIDIEQYNSSKYKNRTALVIKSIHNLLFLNTIIDSIEKLVDSKKIIQIDDCFDDTQGNDLRYVIILKHGADANYVREVIYKNTAMEDRIRVNLECVYGVQPMRLSYSAYIKSFIEMRKITKYRIYANMLQDINTKIHAKEAFIKLLESGEIDNIISMIKSNTKKDSDLIEYIINKVKVTDLQASYIINANLKYLSIRYLDTFKEEYKELNARRDSIIPKLSDDKLIEQEIREELIFIREKYGVKRRCKVIKSSETSGIPEGIMTVVVTDKNFIKKYPDGVNFINNDKITSFIKLNNTDNLILFDESGKCYKIPVHKIPFSDRNNGTDLRFLIKKQVPSKIIYMESEQNIINLNNKFRDTPNQYFLLSVSKDGYAKKMDIIDFTSMSLSNLIYSRVSGDQDLVKCVRIVNNSVDLLTYSDKRVSRINMSNIPLQKRNTKGSKIMSANNIDGINIIDNSYNIDSLIVITQSGKANRLMIESVPYDTSNKNGFNVIKLSKGDKIKYVDVCKESSIYRISTLSGNIFNFAVSNIPIGSSISSGVKLLTNKNNDPVISINLINY